jgi:hypothetical protein
MTPTSRDAPCLARKTSGRWAVLPAVTLAVLGCSGRGGLHAPTDGSDIGAAVGSGDVLEDASVGDSSGDAMEAPRDTKTMVETTDAASEALQDAACDLRLLWDAITRGVRGGLTVCEPYVPDAGMGLCRLVNVGHIVLDGDGRVADNTSLSGEAKQLWLDGVSTMRWPCISGQTLQFMCFECPI